MVQFIMMLLRIINVLLHDSASLGLVRGSIAGASKYKPRSRSRSRRRR